MLMPQSPALTRTWHTVHCGSCRNPFVIVTVPAPMRIAASGTEEATCPTCEVTNFLNVPGQVEEAVFAAAMGLHPTGPVSAVGERREL